ncbi:MAG: zinc-ribbon domain-containing protein [Promethearchaeota archaeon]
MKRTRITHTRKLNHQLPLTLLVITLGLLFILSGFLISVGFSIPDESPQLGSSDAFDIQTSSIPIAMRAQNFTLEGEADLTAFVVNPDGSMTSTVMAVGNVGAYTTSAPPYQECLMAISIFRWGEYQTVFDGILSILTNDTSGGGSEMDALYEILNLLPSNAILMIFTGGSPAEIQGWGNAIHLEFEAILTTPFERIFGLALPLPNMTVGIEAYGFYGIPGPDPVEIQGRDHFQAYMQDLGSTRDGGTELVTSTLAEDAIGGIGLSGFINLAVMEGGFLSAPSKTAMQPPEAITFAAWGSQHKDKFFGTSEQTFDVNDFCGHSGNIEMGSTMTAFEFIMQFPAGVNITSYSPADMVNTTGPEGAMVARPSALWIATPSVPNIIVSFEGDFPPGLSITKTVTPLITIGGTATVTITLENIDPTETVYNVDLDDTESWLIYEGFTTGLVVIDGSLTANWTSIAPGETEVHTYQITVYGEGSYIAQRANITFEDALTRVWIKSSNEALLTVVYGNILDFIIAIMRDIPWSIPVILVILLVAIYAIIWLIKLLLGIVRRSPQKATSPKAPPPPTEDTSYPPPPDEFDYPDKSSSEVTCINCGSPIPPGVSFCPACGAKI